MRAQFITAAEVAEIMGISRSKAYQIVREMNRELKSQGYLTVAGKCPAQYFKQTDRIQPQTPCRLQADGRRPGHGLQGI